MSTRIKVCGVTSEEDARRAVAAGASAVGLLLVPATGRSVDLAQARWIAQAVPADVERVAVVRDLARRDLELLHQAVPVTRIQFHGAESAAVARDLPVAVTRVLTHGDPDPQATIGSWREAVGDVTFLLDLPKKGPTPGREEFLEWAAALPVAREAFLAGCLTPDNVIPALEAVRPAGVDVARGVESAPGIKDGDLLRDFAAAVRHYDARAQEDA